MRQSGNFQAAWPGKCICGEPFEAGAEVYFNDDDQIVQHGCDGTPYEPEPTALSAAQVAKLRSNMCPTCFQIRARNNVCGCS